MFQRRKITEPKYKRVLLKLSGEALAGDQHFGLNHEVIAPVVDQIVEIHNMGVQVGLVIGGGNFWRGRQGTNMDRTTADHMGMLATVMNSLAMMDAIEQRGVPVRVQTALNMVSLAEPFILRKALRHFEQGRIVIFACGTGLSHFTTDTASALRALEVNCQALLKATKVNGVYTADPKKDPTATRFETISFAEVLSRKLGVMDSTAFSLCSDNNLHIVIFNFDEPNALMKILSGDNSVGTVVS